MRRIVRMVLYFSLFTFNFTLLSAQNRTADSLCNVLKTQQSDTARITTINNLCETLWRTGNYDSAMANAIRARGLSEKIAASPDSVIAKKGKNGLAGAYRVMGIIYRHHGNFPKALEYELKALEFCKQTGNTNGIATNTGNIGIVYWNMNNLDKALEYYLKALALNEAMGNKNHMAANIGNIGILYRLKGDYKNALTYEFRALELQRQSGDQSGIATNIGNIGLIYMHQGKYDTALAYDFKALAIIRRIGERGGIAINQSNIGSIYIFQKKFALAKIYLDSAMHLARAINEKEQIKNIYADYCDLDSATGNYKALAADFKTYIVYRDSLVNEANTEKAMQEEMTSDFEQKQAAQKAEQDKKDALAEQERKKQSIILYSFMAGFGLLLVLAFFIYRGYRQKQRANTIITEQKKEVEQQKAIVEEKNNDITASIRYASRIQRALLTTDEYISEHLNDYFILFKPRDIVSGDFYWAFNTPLGDEGADGLFYLACCDCTGHGVPGAFMSLLSISMLNESVIERKVTRPDLILNTIRTSVIKALNPDGKAETKDGMDCTLAAFDFKKMTVQVSCANNPMWIIRAASPPSKGGSQANTGNPLSGGRVAVIEIAADKMPVGIQDSEQKPFTLHTVNIEKGDCIYLFTDGYADQFGGPKGKKLKYKQLQETLLSINHWPMFEQKKVLDKTFENWKGNLEQVDDVLIIGIRV